MYSAGPGSHQDRYVYSAGPGILPPPGIPGRTGVHRGRPPGTRGEHRGIPVAAPGYVDIISHLLPSLVVYVSSIWVVMTQHTEGNGGEQGGGSYHTRVQITPDCDPFNIGLRTPTAASHRGQGSTSLCCLHQLG